MVKDERLKRVESKVRMYLHCNTSRANRPLLPKNPSCQFHPRTEIHQLQSEHNLGCVLSVAREVDRKCENVQ